MKISVAIATYNGEKFIQEQLASILNQTRTVDEVIICDDKSKDNTVEAVNAFIQENNLSKGWSITVNEKNLGYASNFIGAARKTTGDYIFFCDQDDVWLQDRVEKMIGIIEENNKIMLLGSEFSSFSTGEDALSVPKWETKMYKDDKTVEHKEYKPENIFIGAQGCTMCIRGTFFREILPFWYEGFAHDEFVWKMAICLDGLYMYHSYTLNRRLHSNNASLQKMHGIDKRIIFLEELRKSHEATKKFAVHQGLDNKKIHLLDRNIKATTLRIDLLKDKKYFNTFKLLFCYTNCYHKCRSIPVELKMAIQSKKH